MSEWIKWKGGVCPVPSSQRVTVEFKKGKGKKVQQTNEAGKFCWTYADEYCYPITRYKLAAKEKSNDN